MFSSSTWLKSVCYSFMLENVFYNHCATRPWLKNCILCCMYPKKSFYNHFFAVCIFVVLWMIIYFWRKVIKCLKVPDLSWRAFSPTEIYQFQNIAMVRPTNHNMCYTRTIIIYQFCDCFNSTHNFYTIIAQPD